MYTPQIFIEHPLCASDCVRGLATTVIVETSIFVPEELTFILVGGAPYCVFRSPQVSCLSLI